MRLTDLVVADKEREREARPSNEVGRWVVGELGVWGWGYWIMASEAFMRILSDNSDHYHSSLSHGAEAVHNKIVIKLMS